jgi:hypothetical protein
MSRDGWVRVFAGLGIAAAMAAAAGCGGSSERTAKASAGDPDSGALKFTKCMREHGVDVPDPDANGNIRIELPASGSGSTSKAATPLSPTPQFAKAQKACGKYLRARAADRATVQKLQDHALEFARCMRAHGVSDWPDPKVEGGFVKVGPSNQNPNDPRIKKAMSACQKLLPAPSG